MITYKKCIDEIEKHIKNMNLKKLKEKYFGNINEIQKNYLENKTYEEVPEILRGLYRELGEEMKQNILDLKMFTHQILLNQMGNKGIDISKYPKTLKEIMGEMN